MAERQGVQTGRYKVTCPHCGEPFVVNVPMPEPIVKVVHVPAPAPQEAPHHDHVAEPEHREIPALEIAFREMVVETILGRNFELPLLPHVAQKVLLLTNDAKSSMQDIAKVVMTDQMMTTKIIKIANSPVYGGTVKAENVKQALVRLGQREIKNMMLTISMGSKIFKSKAFADLARELWEQAVGAAFASRVIAHALRLDREAAFMAGLLHDLGKMIMLNILEGCQRDLGDGYHPTNETIFDLWNSFQVDVGELAAEKWELPEMVREVIRRYRDPEGIEGPNAKLVATIHLGHQFCRIHGIGGEAEEIDLSESPAMGILGLEPGHTAELIERFANNFEALKSEFM